MNVSLTPELEEIVQNYVKNGMYGNQSEVLRAGLRLLHAKDQEQEAKLQSLRSDINIGLQQVLDGDLVELSAESIKAAGRARLQKMGR
jgi:antitoxin ParD1/3/4